MRILDGEQVLVRIFIGESDRWHHQPLWMALLQRLRKEGYAGATVFRGIGGFGARSVVHTTLLERLSQDLPLVVEIVDTSEHVERLLPVLDDMVSEGLVTIEKARVLEVFAGKAAARPARIAAVRASCPPPGPGARGAAGRGPGRSPRRDAP